MRKFLVLVIAVLLAACSSSSKKAETTTSGCGVKDYAYSVGQSEGAAGTSYTPLILTNVSNRECTLDGVSQAQPISNGALVGLESRPNTAGDVVSTIIVKPGEKVSVLYAVATASNYPSDECVIATSDGVRLTFSGKDSTFSADFDLPGYEICTKLSNTLISRPVAGANG